ncbi:hypothetical protein V7068_19385 [Bacillus sp. JJ634]
MKRRNFLLNFLLWIWSFIFGYRVGNSDIKSGVLSEESAQTAKKDETATVVPLSKFIIATETTHTQAFVRALDYCKTNKVSLFIEDDNYIIDSTVIINMNWDGFSITGNSRDVVIKAKTNGIVFHVQSHRVKMYNIRITPFDDTYNYNYQAIQWDGAQGLCDNFMIQKADIGITCDIACWCTNFTRLSVQGVNKGIVFKYSGGCIVQLDLLSGSAGYEDTQPNSSVGITFESNSGMNTISDGGQIESFHYAFDIKSNSHISIGHVFIEHVLQTFTNTSKIDYLLAYSFYDVSGKRVSPGVSKLTLNGMDKASLYNDAKDSAIPLNELKAYFLFDDVSGSLLDYSGSSATFNKNNLQLSTGIGLFGTQLKMASPGSDSYASLTIPNLSLSKFTIAVSFKVSNTADPTSRIIELTASDNKVIYVANNTGVSITTYDGTRTTKLAMIKAIQSTEYNHFFTLTFDTVTGDITIMCPEMPIYNLQSEVVKSFASGFATNGIKLLRNWDATVSSADYTFNYWMAFNGSITYQQMINIYKQTTPILTIPMYKKLASIV